MTQNKWSSSGNEPLLQDMLNDPIIKLLMKRDNVIAEDILKVMHSLRQEGICQAA